MQCPRCAGEVPDGSRFCNHCGVALAHAQTTAPISGGGTGAFMLSGQAPPPPPTTAAEEEVWSGGPSLRAFVTSILTWSLITGMCLVFILLMWDSPSFATGAWGAFLVILGSGGYVWGVIFAKRLTLRYRLTSQRLFMEQGFFRRRINELDLLRVDDISIVQTLPQKLVDAGNIIIISSDATNRRTTLFGIEKPLELKEKIREKVTALRSRSVQVKSY